MRTYFVVLASILLLPSAIAAKDEASLVADPRVVDAIHVWEEWVEYQAATSRVPAVSIGIVHDQELLSANAFGFVDPENRTPASADTLYSICSISKLFTSVGVMQQRDAGRLRLDDPVSEHLDWFDLQDVHDQDGPITIRGLLTHSAGLPRESDFDYWTGSDHPFPTSEEIRERLGAQTTLYPASRYHQYSNLGLTLAGEIVAERSAQEYDEYIRTHILEPLGMNDTTTEVPIDERGSRLAIGYSALQRNGEREAVAPFQARGIAPAAGFASNVPDLARFAMWQFRLLNGGEEELLRSSTLREMHRVQWVDPDWRTTWGLGFVVQHAGDRTFVQHSGGCPGYITYFRLEPKTRMAAIVLTSAIGSAASLWSSQAFELIAPAIKAAQDTPDKDIAVDPGLERLTGVYDSIWGQTAIVRWQNGLAMLPLATSTPKQALVELRKTGDNSFRVVRKDDQSLGEEIVFDLGDSDQVRRFKRHSNWYTKVR